MSHMPGDSPETSSGAFMVGDLHVDVGQQRVTRAGSDIALPNLSFRLLVALIRAAPNVLSNDSLMTQVWPGLVVSPETVNKRVNLLREAIGDDSREPRYIAGIRSRGYRLIAPLSAASGSTAPLLNLPAPLAQVARPPDEMPIPPVPMQPPPTAAPKSRWPLGRWVVFSFLATGLLAVAANGIRWTARHPHQAAIAVPASSPAAVGALARTVAVLRFDSISAEAADAYLAQGLPEMILNRLSRISGLSVIARNSSFALDTKTIDSREIGRRLNSGYLIDGSVQRKADRLRVAVQLVDTAAGTQVWSAHFDRALSDIFSVEDEIANQVADALSAHLGGLDPKPVPNERSSNIEAYLAYLRGRTLLGRFTVAESDSAVPYFERATTLDPKFAAAYASLYDAHLQAADQRHEDLAPMRQRYRPLIDRALAIDPNSGTAYFARAMWGNGSYEARDADFRQGVALDPSNGRGLTAYAEFLDSDYDRPEEAARVLQRALWIDPMSPRAHFHAAMRSLDEGGANMVENNMLGVLELDPDFVPALQRLGKYRWLLHDRLTEAVQILEHAIALDPANPWLRHTAMAVYLDLGEEQAAREVAAGTPQSARATGLLSMYVGDWRAAARAAYDDAGWTYDFCENWRASEALRDYALRTGELTRAIAFIKLKYYFEDAPAAHLDVCNCRAAIVLSQLLTAQGHPQQGVDLRHAAATWNDVNAAKYAGDARRIRAEALLLDDKKDAALAELAASFPGGNYVQWWYTLNFDPVWLPLHNDSRFQAIEADVRRHIDAQRNELEALRRNGLVPRRGPTAVAR
jgi:TolB-like protein/DNA-binding winged helix-turn-helix (wHTH) protein